MLTVRCKRAKFTKSYSSKNTTYSIVVRDETSSNDDDDDDDDDDDEDEKKHTRFVSNWRKNDIRL